MLNIFSTHHHFVRPQQFLVSLLVDEDSLCLPHLFPDADPVDRQFKVKTFAIQASNF